tara:strand:+ start:882 stop:1970 length:1089 start_codon:yes stop_codon:yes gene_type:complete
MKKESNMTEEVQDQELHDEVTDEVVEVDEAMGHDPKNAEAQSIAATDKAGDATGGAKKRKGDQTKKDPMKMATKGSLITAMVSMMQGMNKQQVQGMYANYKKMDGVEVDDEALVETKADVDVSVDFSEDLNALVESEATLSDEFKGKAETIFEAAIKSKLSEEIDRLETKYEEELAEEVASTKADLVEKVDNYLNYVVEQWMDDNKLAIQTGLRTEIAENFMNSLKDLFTESYIEVPEAKVDLVDELAVQVEELEEANNDVIKKNIEMTEELEELKRNKVIAEASEGLAATQVEKLKKLAEDVDFESEETFAQKVATIKESYFTKKTTESADIEVEEDDSPIVESASGAMAQYLSAIQRTSK